ncbi:cysteine desulfurase-like protein [Actinophytocola oryzae]|uniref:Cysteine desulfurase family protein (TIGR01976 family) n=1 Tax=Actinophytocola oryzae TaxID=502181 RepID=A0A4R7V3D7_9PSEU|nr:cysteine desulfurase-like protein [Actinophytocola oryzae]TDV43194.1 cysteine desulfurase family protein (TIGR01976 family) [Actinophytocola oryzae]
MTANATDDRTPTRSGFDPTAVRAGFPALDDDWSQLDAAAGTQVPQTVIDAVAGAYRAGMANVNGVFPASHRIESIVTDARLAVADLLGGQADGVVFGPNMTTLTYRIAATLASDWRAGDEVVVCRLDHDANVRPWVQAAEHAGATVRWAEVDVPSGELPAERFDALVNERTKLVAVSAASNVLGTMPDLPAIADTVHRAGALLYVDGVHATPHLPIDVTALGADFFATSAYKWCGPHVGAVVADPELLARLRPDKLAPAPDRVPDRFEHGTPPFADLAGVTAAVDHLAGLDPTAGGSRRDRILASMSSVEAYERAEFAHLLGGLSSIPHVRLVGSPRRRTPTAFFTVDGIAPRDVARKLAEGNVNVWSGHAYAWEVTGALGVRDSGGAVRAGLVHYNVRAEVDRLLDAVAGMR